ncbi:MAG: hypothetical protein AB1578_22795 [Thermodesulfobacteriota bacterium]
MILVCPSCAATHSAEAWITDAAIRETLGAAVKLPKPVQEQLWPYLALFRPPQRALSWVRARRLVGELHELVGAGRVSWEKEADRPCTPELWARGMAEMVGRKGGFKAHFTGHNYLRKVVWDLADQADREVEARRSRAEREGRRPAPSDRSDRSDGADGEAPVNVRELLGELAGKLGVKR